MGNKYFFISFDGKIYEASDWGSVRSNELKRSGNYFLSEEDAGSVRDLLLLILKLSKKYSPEEILMDVRSAVHTEQIWNELHKANKEDEPLDHVDTRKYEKGYDALENFDNWES